MTEYADRKIKDILTKAKGQGKLAEQHVRAAIAEDHKFLLKMVEPYLGGIIAHAIERTRKQSGIKETTAPQPNKTIKAPTQAPRAAVSSAPKGSVDNLLKAWAKKFDQDDNAPKSAVSQKHLDAMNSLVRKNYSKKEKA